MCSSQLTDYGLYSFNTKKQEVYSHAATGRSWPKKLTISGHPRLLKDKDVISFSFNTDRNSRRLEFWQKGENFLTLQVPERQIYHAFAYVQHLGNSAEFVTPEFDG